MHECYENNKNRIPQSQRVPVTIKRDRDIATKFGQILAIECQKCNIFAHPQASCVYIRQSTLACVIYMYLGNVWCTYAVSHDTFFDTLLCTYGDIKTLHIW